MITTRRLSLIPNSVETLDAALLGREKLARSLGALVPETWPPQFLDDEALHFARDRLIDHPDEAGWWMYFVLRREGGLQPILIGTGGYKGPPDADGLVEVGYGIVREHQRLGYATEVVHGLLERAFAAAGVRGAIAETLPSLVPSIGVLRKCGFTQIAGGSEPGVIRFSLPNPKGA